MSTSPDPRSEPVLSPRRLGLAGAAAFLGCAACCAVPALAAAGLGSGALASLSWVLRPGAELLVGGVVFVVALGVMGVSSRVRRRASGCGPSCEASGACCERGAARSA